MARFKNKSTLILIAILAIATLLRFVNLSRVPVSLFGDELDVGYHAYSILKTGKDYVGNPWPLHFQSLAEYRTPLYLYSVVPTVALFGISPLGVRLPAAIFGVLSIYVFYLLIRKLLKRDDIALIAAAVMTFSPWHIQYSRAAFEVTQLLFVVLLGFYAFFLSIEKKDNNKYLWISTLSFGLAPWVYSTGKLFVPMIFVVLFVLWFKQIVRVDRKSLIIALVMILVTAIPMVYVTLNGQSSQRFGYISVFTDPVVEPDIGFARDSDILITGDETSFGAIGRRIFHNKYLYWGQKITSNFLKTYSTDFLFITGDKNLRHSIDGMGQLYRVEFIPLLIGLGYFFVKLKDKKVKVFVLSWFILGTIPSAITRDGGDHATRLIILLPIFVLIIAIGLHALYKHVIKNKLFSKAVILIYGGVFVLSFVLYQHNYWIHNPLISERWWHGGFSEAIQAVKDVQADYDTVYISNAGEPPWIFFAAWYEYPPAKWQTEYPVEAHMDTGIPFEEVTYIDKFRFGQVSKIGIYALGQYIDNKTLYLASAREVGNDLIQNPGATPANLELIKAVAYKDGLPAFYLFKGTNDKPQKDAFAQTPQE